MNKILLCARREYSATVLTKAFFLGAIIFPLVAWGAIIGVTASGVFNAEKEPLSGTYVVVDGTRDQSIGNAIAIAMDPEAREGAREEIREKMEQGASMFPQLSNLTDAQKEMALNTTYRMLGLSSDITVNIDIKSDGTGLDELQRRLRAPQEDDNAILAYAIVGEPSLLFPPNEARIEAAAEEAGQELTDELREQLGIGEQEEVANPSPDELRAGRVRIVHRQNLDPDYVSLIQRETLQALEYERYRRAGINPDTVREYEAQRPIADTRMIGDDGQEEDSTATAQRLIPIAFFLLLYLSVLTGGNYLFMGTLEEKGSRVMEVLLSAVSPMHLLIGKLVGQGLVGLTVLGIYLTLGLLAADRFGFLSAIPMDALPWMLPYFLMAYLFFGALFVAVGSAVTEVREAQSLFAPVTFLIILIFVILFPIMDNPGAPIARVMSYFPPATPFVMVMRMSQPSHVVPLWEFIATGIVGTLGVVFTIWIAAKIFRVGVLMYGKPPSFGTLLKWVMQS